MSNSAHLELIYAGPALDAGQMDVRDLAPALLGIGGVFETANTILNQQRQALSVKVKATKHGSFGVEFELVQNILNVAVGFLTSSPMTAGLNLVGLVSAIWGTIRGIQWIAGRNVDKIEKKQSEVIIYIDNAHFSFSLQSFKLYEDFEFRQSLAKVIAEPLVKDGLEQVVLKSDSQPSITVSKHESQFFQAPSAIEEVLVEEIITKAFTIVSLAFKEDNKWRLSDGISTISVLIADKYFVSQIESGNVAFAKNDVLICKVKALQKRANNTLTTEYTVIQVLEHKPSARQLAFQLTPEK